LARPPVTARVFQSEYMHWAKTRAPVTYNLASSEVPHFHMDRWAIDPAGLELDGASYHRYPPLRAAIAAKCGVTAAQVVMADGTSMANMLAMSALIAPGDKVAIERPAYEPMVAAAAFLGADIRRFERRAPDFALDPEAIPRRCRLIVLTNLHNPTGNLADAPTLRAVAERAEGHVLIDEVYLDSALPDQTSAALLDERFVCTSSLTKCYGLSGLRCGWILAAPALAERLWRLNELFGVAQAHQAERLACLALARLDEIAAQNGPLLARNRALANAFLAGRSELEAAPMTGGITAFPRLLHGDVDALNDLVRARYDTSIVPGRFFGLADHFRIGIGGTTEIVEAGLERLGAALDEFA
jgi:aspartate/methionine/tyrosine aminotransferase